MLQVGVTGGIGSGKSLVCKIFRSLGVPIYEADIRAKELTNSDSIKKEIIGAFGSESYVYGTLNREYLAQEVFGNKEKLTLLNSIIHPAVAQDYKLWVQKYSNEKLVIKEAAILFESGSYKACDFVILVDAPESLRLKRVMNRDNTSKEDVLKRMSNQWSSKKKAELSNFIIENDSVKPLLPQVITIYKTLLVR